MCYCSYLIHDKNITHHPYSTMFHQRKKSHFHLIWVVGFCYLSIFNAYNATSDSKHCYMGLEECIDPPQNLNLEPFQLCACRIFNFIGLYRSHNIEKALVGFCFHQWQLQPYYQRSKSRSQTSANNFYKRV